MSVKTFTHTANYNFLLENFARSKVNRWRMEKPIRVLGLEGASRTGKTFDTSIFIWNLVTKYTGRRILILRGVLTHLKKSVYQTFKQVGIKYFNIPSALFNESASPINFNGNRIVFDSTEDDPNKFDGVEADIVWMNEAVQCSQKAFDDLEQRCLELMILDYNPSEYKSWVYDLELRPDYKVKRSLFTDNKYCPEYAFNKLLSYAHPDITDDYAELGCKLNRNYRISKEGEEVLTEDEWEALKRKNVDQGTANKFRWLVYGLGRRTVSTQQAFKKLLNFTDFPKHFDWETWAIDFGYSDPSALVRCIKVGKDLYLKQYIYETELLNSKLAEKITANNYHLYDPNGNDSDAPFICDSAQPEGIKVLNSNDIAAVGYIKFPSSVTIGAWRMMEYNIHIHVDSHDLRASFESMRWKVNPKTSELVKDSRGIPILESSNKHGFDAGRYASTYYDDLQNYDVSQLTESNQKPFND